MAVGAAPLDRRRLLANVSIFASLDERALDALVRVTSTRRLDAGEVLFRKGDPGRQLYGVLDGRLKILGRPARTARRSSSTSAIPAR